MTTQTILDDIKRALSKGKHVPSGDVRALLAICEALRSVVTKQQDEITVLKASLPKQDPEPEPRLAEGA